MARYILSVLVALLGSVFLTSSPREVLAGPVAFESHSSRGADVAIKGGAADIPAVDVRQQIIRRFFVYGGLTCIFAGSILAGGLIPGIVQRVLAGELASGGLGRIIVDAARQEGFSTFISGLVSQVTTLGIVYMGAPMWEPLQAGIKQGTFQFIQGKGPQHPTGSQSPMESNFDRQWHEMQSNFSFNAQMTRNVYVFMLMSLEDSMKSADLLFRSNQQDRAAGTFALAVIRHRQLFPEIDPASPLILLTIRQAFPSICGISAEFEGAIIQKVRAVTEGERSADSAYLAILNEWLHHEC